MGDTDKTEWTGTLTVATLVAQLRAHLANDPGGADDHVVVIDNGGSGKFVGEVTGTHLTFADEAVMVLWFEPYDDRLRAYREVTAPLRARVALLEGLLRNVHQEGEYELSEALIVEIEAALNAEKAPAQEHPRRSVSTPDGG